MNQVLVHACTRLRVWMAIGLVSGCASLGTSKKVRNLNEEVERPDPPKVQLTATLQSHGETIEANVSRETTYQKFNKVQIRRARKFVNGTTPALIWGGFGVGTALTGLIVRYAETQQSVERVRFVTGNSTQTPETSYRTRPARSRVASSTFFVSGGVLVTVGLGQLASPLLPPFKVEKHIEEQYVTSRLEVSHVPQSTVSLLIGNIEVTSASTNTEGRALLQLSDLAPVNDWSWTGAVRAEGATTEVDLRNSREVGTAAGRWAHEQVTSGSRSRAKNVVSGVEPHHKAYLPAWNGFCDAAKPLTPTLNSPDDARVLLPDNASQTCTGVILGIESRAAVQIRAALRNKDPALAQSWLPLAASDKQATFSTLIDQKEAQLEAAEFAAERALLRRQRQTWKSRTDRALATCVSTHREIDRRKAKVQQLSYAGQMGRAQTELERFQDWMERTGQPRMSAALEDIRAIKDEMDEQGISEEIQIPWMRRVGGACGN
jgi:hypothetical protein